MPRISYKPKQTIVNKPLKHSVITADKIDYILQNTTLGRIELDAQRYTYLDKLPYSKDEVFYYVWAMNHDYYTDEDDNHYKLGKDGIYYDSYNEKPYKGDPEKITYCPKIIVFSEVGWNPNLAEKVYILLQIDKKAQLFQADWMYEKSNSDFTKTIKPLTADDVTEKLEKSFINLYYLIENLLSEEGYKKAKKKFRAKKKTKKLIKKKRTAYQELVKLCIHSKYQTEVLNFFDNITDYDGDEEYLTTLNYVIETLNEKEFYFIVALDVSSGGEDLEFFLEKIIRDNYPTIIEQKFPSYDKEDALGNMTILEIFDMYLRKQNLQMGFIDTDADEYVLFIHKIPDQKVIENLVKEIGYKYYFLEHPVNIVEQNTKSGIKNWIKKIL